ncbi:glycosyl transferase, family 2 [Legionella gratiana]|uniref:Glycosyl transferase, family 2 n=1 Tax=Legionella gratiana TaxID=45066 RepID=A0A378JG14_9GAMM|nr:glycosyltransferase [Legionella gratiana]KTD14155.1 glycosyl transferase, family 2 [Legionella gratiana]STX46286.1 glycosyl transferase, family 2 [Legionella gratiana]
MFRLMEIWRRSKVSNKKTIRICKNSVYFDANWYLNRYPDVKASGLDPVFHFVQYGAVERRDPGPNFSTADYLSEYPEVEKEGINPLVHLEKTRKKFTNTKRNYKDWVSLYDTITESDRQNIKDKIANLEYTPTISIVMPVYNSSEKWLKLAIDSVLKQLYPYWELCIADDASTAAHVKQVLSDYVKRDSRIKVIYRETNGHISESSNSALQLATGEFIALLDHDDELTEHALYKIAEELNYYPNAVLIYSDEDKIDSYGTRYEPYFKSDWNPDLFYSHNFISHLGVYKRSVVNNVGGFRKGYEGSQDYDLALRVIEVITPDQIRHIPHVLYHWRILSESVSNSKAYTCEDTARNAIQAHLERQNIIGAQVGQNPFLPNFHRVIYPLPKVEPLVSIIIPTKDKVDVLKCCIESILKKTEYSNFELIIVDNQSQQQKTYDYFEQLKQNQKIKIIPYYKPFNYSKINNFAVTQAQGEIVLFLNNDTEVISSCWLTEMVSQVMRTEIGVVGAKLYYPDDTIQHAGVIGGYGLVAGHIFSRWPRKIHGYMGKDSLSQNFLAVTAACMAMRRSVFEELDGFEENTLKVAFNDVDLCLRAYSKGYRILWTPYAELYHHESLTRGSAQTEEEKAQEKKEVIYMVKYWSDLLQNDPFYNPNLSLTGSHYSLAFPPRCFWNKSTLSTSVKSKEVDLPTSPQVTLNENLISPYEFDKDYYLTLYPDIANADIDPYFHFINYGKSEGRRGSPFNLYKDVTPFNDANETVLLVSHDASRTGAPILALNIAEELKKQFNVVILLLNSGGITLFFEQTCNAIISIDRSIHSNRFFIDNLVHQAVEQYNVKFSIVNSIESFYVLEPLARRFIPSILLIHEFATYTRPHCKFMDAFLWAGKIVFPAKIVQDNAISNYTEKAIHSTQVLSQGKSNIPVEAGIMRKNHEINIKSHKTYDNQLQSKPFLVLGVGSVHYRKGVDLFIATAAELKRSYPEYNIKMLWVGSGYDPEHDISYSCYLEAQIERSNLTGYFELIDEVSNLDELYQQADLFYLSSRLDPLPNVAIDVMVLGKPLICFDQGTGIAEILQQDSDTTECIISHLSIIESMQKIIRFYQSPEYYSLISSKIKKLAQNYFDMNNYVSNLLFLSKNQMKLVRQEELDCITLENSDDFKVDFYLQSDVSRQDAIRKYVRSWHSKVNLLRKPAPGFNQTIYHIYNKNKDDTVEPFADYIRSGKPKGPWQEQIIIPSDSFFGNEKKLRCAIHIHVFYSDLLKDLMDRIQINESDFDVYVSTNEVLFKQVSEILSDYEQINTKIKAVPNRGRDIGPLISAFADELQKYEVIGHFHTKKSLDIKNAQFARDWYLFLIENLLGGKHLMADQIINEFKKDIKIGLVFADDPYLLDWGKNKVFADELAEKMKLSSIPEHHFNFPVGTMFWARPEAIKPLFELKYSWDMYPEEPLPYDGSILHAMERLIPIIVSNQGFTQALTHIPGLTR